VGTEEEKMPVRTDTLSLCLAALETAERALLEIGDLASAVHVTLAIDRFRATHQLPERPLDPAMLAIEPELPEP
jgi:hypothetical protein